MAADELQRLRLLFLKAVSMPGEHKDDCPLGEIEREAERIRGLLARRNNPAE